MSSNTDNSPDLNEVDDNALPDAPQNSGADEAVEQHAHPLEHQVELLESQLQEKEDLVFALTERLEQAAEQLDRYRRSGAKQNRGGGGSLPKEVIEEQKTLFEEMRQMISQWEATQPGATLGRIELQVTELRDLVAGNVLGGGGAAAPAPKSGDAEISGALAALMKTPEKDKKAPPKPASQASGDFKPGSWEAQKAALMAGESVPAPAPADTAPPETEVPEATEPEAAADDPDTPTPINLEEADTEQLRQAVLERDRIIESLKERLAQGGGSGEVVKYDSMESMPDEFREKLEALEEEWKEKIRETEVELSLERAKIAREKAELQQQQHQMQKQREKLGLGNPAAGKGDAQTPEEAGSGRWLRFLKRGGDDAE